MSQNICYLSATELAERIRSKVLSPVEVMDAHLERIQILNPRLNAIVTMSEWLAESASKAEEAIMRGDALGPLHGVPFTIKDTLDTKLLRTTRGSRLFEDFVPEADATSVARLKEAGGILIGKTNTPEFAFWWETDNLVFGRTENPWGLDRTPGGSSGGEASAIAAGLSPLGLGSDLGGSIRQPAAFCGIVGLKATHGRVPITGNWPGAIHRYFHVGPMARSVKDVSLALSILSGSDGVDPYALSVPKPKPDVSDLQLDRLRIGWCADGPFEPVDIEVKDAVREVAITLEGLGLQVEHVSLDGWDQWSAQDMSAAIFVSEMVFYIKPRVVGREALLGPVIRRRIDSDNLSLDEYLESSEKIELLRQEVAKYFKEYDLLVCPTTPIAAPPHDSREFEVGGCRVQGRNLLSATIPFNITGSPAISVPFGLNMDGLPIGVQLVGRHLREDTLLSVASAVERESGELYQSSPSLCL